MLLIDLHNLFDKKAIRIHFVPDNGLYDPKSLV